MPNKEIELIVLLFLDLICSQIQIELIQAWSLCMQNSKLAFHLTRVQSKDKPKRIGALQRLRGGTPVLL